MPTDETRIAIQVLWDSMEIGPCAVYISVRELHHTARRTMGRRAYRRWRGRMRLWARMDEVVVL